MLASLKSPDYRRLVERIHNKADLREREAELSREIAEFERTTPPHPGIAGELETARRAWEAVRPDHEKKQKAYEEAQTLQAEKSEAAGLIQEIYELGKIKRGWLNKVTFWKVPTGEAVAKVQQNENKLRTLTEKFHNSGLVTGSPPTKLVQIVAQFEPGGSIARLEDTAITAHLSNTQRDFQLVEISEKTAKDCYDQALDRQKELHQAHAEVTRKLAAPHEKRDARTLLTELKALRFQETAPAGAPLTFEKADQMAQGAVNIDITGLENDNLRTELQQKAEKAMQDYDRKIWNKSRKSRPESTGEERAKTAKKEKVSQALKVAPALMRGMGNLTLNGGIAVIRGFLYVAPGKPLEKIPQYRAVNEPIFLTKKRRGWWKNIFKPWEDPTAAQAKD